MSNVLPPVSRKAVWRMFRARFIVAGSILAMVIAALCALALLPSYLALHSGDEANAASSTISKTANAEDREVVAGVRALLAAVSPALMGTTTPTQALAQALALRPAGISIVHLTYSRGSQGSLVLEGTSATREAINGYRQALTADTHFKTVSIPVGDLTGAPGGRFSISLTGDF